MEVIVICIFLILFPLISYLVYRHHSLRDLALISKLLVIMYSWGVIFSIVILIGGFVLSPTQAMSYPFDIGLIALGATFFAVTIAELHQIYSEKDIVNIRTELNKIGTTVAETNEKMNQVLADLRIITDTNNSIIQREIVIESLLTENIENWSNIDKSRKTIELIENRPCLIDTMSSEVRKILSKFS